MIHSVNTVYPTVVRDRFGEWPIHRRLTMRFFRASALEKPAETVAQCVSAFLSIPHLRDEQFTSIQYRALEGTLVSLEAGDNGIKDLFSALESGRARSLELSVCQSEELGESQLFATFLRDMTGDEDVSPNELSAWITLGSLAQHKDFNLFEFFCETVERFGADFAFSAIYLDAGDSETLSDVYESVRRFAPVETINSAYYQSFCDTRIKGIGWLTYLSPVHLSRLGASAVAEIASATHTRSVGQGLALSLGSDPLFREGIPANFALLQALVKPLAVENPGDVYGT